MVMADFTPQYIGREFVRQYYTMLYKDPTQLHRFYMKQSLYTHASLPNRLVEPVIGQEEIHKKIMQLNFRECFSKIKSVDSQKTINGGVVVQVAGELSNRGMPMRKFTQTFVLEAEAPQRYYVFNDIFRYQDDEIEYEEQTDETAPEYSSADEEVTPDEPATTEYEPPTISPEVEAPENAILVQEPVDLYQSEQVISKSLTNGNHHLEEEEPVDEPNEQYNTEVKDAGPQPEPEEPVEEVATPNAYEDTMSEEEKQEEVPIEPEQEEIPAEEPVEPEGPPKPVTWAAFVKKNTPATSSPPSAPVAARPAVVKAQTTPPSAPMQQRPPRRREETPRRENRDEGRRKFSGAPPDNHQIFIGNLPTGISEADVRGIFKEFGNIVEVRLNLKNFGFVAFDSPEPAEKVLKKEKPIVFGKATINVEEKRASGSAGARGGPRREFTSRSRNDSGSKNGAPGGRQGQPPGNRDRPRGGPMGQQKPRGGLNTGEGRGESSRGSRNRDRTGPIRR